MLNQFFQSDSKAQAFRDGRALKDERRTPLAIMPGAFNPLHRGHTEMARWASAYLERNVHFEISVINVDKQTLGESDCRQRLEQFDQQQTVWLTRAPLFRHKASLFPQAIFIVGADTIRRIGDVRYYHDEQDRQDSIHYIATANCRFLVFGRVDPSGPFRALDDLELPDRLRAICTSVEEDAFRVDISSSELRDQYRMTKDEHRRAGDNNEP